MIEFDVDVVNVFCNIALKEPFRGGSKFSEAVMLFAPFIGNHFHLLRDNGQPQVAWTITE